MGVTNALELPRFSNAEPDRQPEPSEKFWRPELSEHMEKRALSFFFSRDLSAGKSFAALDERKCPTQRGSWLFYIKTMIEF
ncbi:hypothetical protein AB4Y42_36155 [Paraburkholderia sp. EG286B]|uniref:hypothetical protein n=1 Tax=Paraburkholderia sp. EG286B TaxID=3237011 RepID=UPI0034D21346